MRDMLAVLAWHRLDTLDPVSKLEVGSNAHVRGHDHNAY
jgi:hypothetical protein